MSGSQRVGICPLAEDDVLRMVGHARYPNSPGTAAVAPLTLGLRALPGHALCTDVAGSRG